MFFSGSKHRHPEHCHEDPMSKHLEHHDQVNVLEHHDQVNVAKVVFQWLTVWGFCGSFLLLLPCTAKPSLSGPACSPTTRSKQATLIIVFRLCSRQCLKPSSCWSCPRLLACWPSLMGGACFHNIILSFLPSCETFYNGGDKQKRFSISETKRWLICVSITRSSSNILQPRQWWVVGCPTFPANATTAALQFYPMQPCSVLPKSYPPFPTGALTIPHQMCSVPHRRPTVSHQRPTFPYSSPLCSPPNV